MRSKTKSGSGPPGSQPRPSTLGRSGSSTESRGKAASALAVAASFAAAGFVALASGRAGAAWDDAIGDSFFRLRYAVSGPAPIDPSIAVVGLSDADEEALGLASGGREPFARLIDSLAAAGAARILVDVAFPDRGGTPGDEALAASVAEAGTVLLPVVLRAPPAGAGASFGGSEAGPAIGAPRTALPSAVPFAVSEPGRPVRAFKAARNYAALDAAAAAIGHINSQPDRDGVFRRVPLVIEHEGALVPSLALAAAVDALRPARVDVRFGECLTLVGAAERGGADIRIPIDARGMAILDLPGPWADSYPYFPAAALVSALGDPDVAAEAREALSGANVVVADLSTASSDYGPTAYDAVYPLAGMHAAVLSAILSGRMARAPGPAEIAAWAIAVAAAIAAAAAFSPAFFLPAVALALGSAAALQFVLFLTASMLPALAWPLAGAVASAVAVSAGRYVRAERERARVSSRMERYFAPEVVARILKSGAGTMSAERKTVTILFSDIAGFTSWCSGRDPADIHRTLNAYFELMTGIVFKHGGTVDKFIGDGLMAIFGDPIAQPDHALRAVRAALEMQAALAEARSRPDSALAMRIRVGVNTGEAVVGDLGSNRIMAYTAIGSSVNVASRLEGKAPVDGVLISESTYGALEGAVPTRYAGKTSAKGIPGEFDAWEVLASPNG